MCSKIKFDNNNNFVLFKTIGKIMLEELIPIIIEVIISNKKPMTIEDIIENSSFGDVEVSRGLNLLLELGLLKRTSKGSVVYYSLIKELRAIHLAKAAQLGVNLSLFDTYFKIDEKEKKIALELSTNVEKLEKIDINKRKPLLLKRKYFDIDKKDEVYDNLMILFETSNLTLYDYIEKLSEKDPYLKILLNIHKEAEESIKNYVANIR